MGFSLVMWCSSAEQNEKMTGIVRPTNRLATFVHALLFVLGFAIVLVVGWDGPVTVIGSSLERTNA
jgi:cytochrome c biogenesis protein CcdA